jgi:hypothetical protein
MVKQPPGEGAFHCPEDVRLVLGSNQTTVPLVYALLDA